MNKKLNKIFKESQIISIDDNSKIVIMSDCHRGAGDNYDNFIKNKNIYLTALIHYFNSGFTYIELGDGDEMWEVKNFENIVDKNLNVFKQLKKFYDSGRLMMLYGNHDIFKKFTNVLEDYFYKYYNQVVEKEEPLLDELIVNESLILNYKEYDMFLIHGHQVDFLNGKLWRLSRFLVHNMWRALEYIGIKDPTSGAKNNKVRKKAERKLEKWSIRNNIILISGHTHRPIFPKVGHSLYFNDGSCVHADGITCLEIENGNISLVKWSFVINKNQLLSVKKEVLAGKEPIINFFQ